MTAQGPDPLTERVTADDLRAMRTEVVNTHNRVNTAYVTLWSWTDDQAREVAKPLSEVTEHLRAARDILERVADSLASAETLGDRRG